MITMLDSMATPRCVKLNGSASDTSNHDNDDGHKSSNGESASSEEVSTVEQFVSTVRNIIKRIKIFRLKQIFDYLSKLLKDKGLTPEDVSDVLARLEEYAVTHHLKLVEEVVQLPQTWEEAKVKAPGLMRWEEAKAINPALTIIAHLQDKEKGYGQWATVEPGLPRRHLVTVFRDEAAYDALNIFLRRHKLPEGLYLPKKSEIIDRLADGGKDDPNTRSARVDWAMRARAYKARRDVEKLR